MMFMLYGNPEATSTFSGKNSTFGEQTVKQP